MLFRSRHGNRNVADDIQPAGHRSSDDCQETLARDERTHLDAIDAFVGKFVDDRAVNRCSWIWSITNDRSASDDVRCVLMLPAKLTKLSRQEPSDITNTDDAVSDEEWEEEIELTLVLDVRMNIPESWNQVLAGHFNDARALGHANILRRSDRGDAVVVDHDRGISDVPPGLNVNDGCAAENQQWL